MGALTLKTFPFELRGWDIEKFESVDPTDGFGVITQVYRNKQQIIQIEPDHTETSYSPWLSDKGRQFFDGIFATWGDKNDSNQIFVLKKKNWQKNIQTLLKTLYLFEFCTIKNKTAHFFTIVFENLGIETTSLLKTIEQKYSFIKLRRAENLSLLNDLESSFQLNTATDANKLKFSSLCFLVANNSRYEGYHLNIRLRQRFLKGNFKCLKLSSHINLTFPSSVIGTNFKILKEITEGNSFICQDLKTATNPFIVFGSEFHKRVDSKNILNMLKRLNIFSYIWNGLNTLNMSLTETGLQNIANFLPLKRKDFNESSSFYFLNITTENIPNLTKITETKLLNYTIMQNIPQPDVNKLVLDQNSNIKNNQAFAQNLLELKTDKEYIFFPIKMFYETEETFLNTEGLFKKTSKLITKQKTKEGWKLVRSLLNYFKNCYTSLSFRNENILSFDPVKQTNFSKFIYFHYCAVEKLDNFNSFSNVHNQSFFICHQELNFKQKSCKIINSKSKYWLDDFFTGGKDEYSKNSLVLTNCSKILRAQTTNFF